MLGAAPIGATDVSEKSQRHVFQIEVQPPARPDRRQIDDASYWLPHRQCQQIHPVVSNEVFRDAGDLAAIGGPLDADGQVLAYPKRVVAPALVRIDRAFTILYGT